MRQFKTKPTGRPRTRPATDYHARHYLVGKARGKASQFLCEGCCGGKARHWATIHGRDGLDPFLDYVPLCAKCHDKYDAQIHGTRGHIHTIECTHSTGRAFSLQRG